MKIEIYKLGDNAKKMEKKKKNPKTIPIFYFF